MKYIVTCLLLLIAVNSFAQTELTSGQKLQQQIKGNEKNTYKVAMQNGGLFQCNLVQMGKDLAIDLISPSGKNLQTFDSPNGENGNEPISFEAGEQGNYKLVVSSLEQVEHANNKRDAAERPTNYQIKDIVILTAAENAKKKAKEKEVQQAGINWIEKNAHPIKSITPGSNFQDLQWMKPVLENVKYVGLGEATHGTKDFFQFKHRMLEFLVKEMGYTGFAIEASYAGCKNINDYVLTGKGSAQAALASQGFWTWNTQEVLDMIEWIRAYNTTVKEDKKVQVFGFDIQYNTLGGGTAYIKNYLKKVAPAIAQQNDSFFTLFPLAEQKQMKDSSALKVRKYFATLKRAIATNRDSFIRNSSRDEYENAMAYANTISEYLGAYISRGNNGPRAQQLELRDRYMAANLKRFAQTNPDMKIVIWAHNSHINKNPEFEVNGGRRPMGSHLRNSFGNAYYAMAFLFNKGNFQAMDNGDTTGKMKLKEFTAGTAKEGSMEWLMAQASKGNYIVNFRTQNSKDKNAKNELPADVKAFTEKEYTSRMFGATASDNFVDENYFTPITISKDFDALIFIDNTTAAKPLKK